MPASVKRLPRVTRRQRTVSVAAVVALSAGGVTVAALDRTPAPTPAVIVPAVRPVPATPAPPVPAPVFDRAAFSVDHADSLWAIVNKTRPLDVTGYAPDDLVSVPVAHIWPPLLRKPAADAVVAMFAAYTADTGLRMQSQSSYRSFDSQTEVYEHSVAVRGRKATDVSVARPGTSEHQTGLAIDISALPSNCTLAACFGDTPQGRWAAANAWEYGFVLRYPADKVEVTGYQFEPWHYRYVGKPLAAQMRGENVQTLEEFFLTGGPEPR